MHGINFYFRWLFIGMLVFSLAGFCLEVGPDANKDRDKKVVGNADHEEKALPVLPLQLTDGAKPEVSFTWREVESGKAIISVWNSVKDAQKLSVTLTDFDIAAGSIGLAPSPIHLDVTPGSASLDGFRVTRFTLKLSDPAVVPPARGSYSGLLRVEGDAAKFSSFSQRIRINVVGPQPGVTKATVIAWRLAPIVPVWCASINVPLTDEYKSSEFTDTSRIVGYVHRPYGGFAAVRWTELKPAHHGKPARAHLVISHLPGAGQYDGDISLGGLQDKTAPLALTVIAKDIAVFPILIMVLGIALAWLAKRYVGVLRSAWILRRDEADLGRVFQESQKAFSEATAGKPCASYSIARDVVQQRKLILANLKLVVRSMVTSLDNNTDYANAKATLDALQIELQQWALFGPELACLQASLEDMLTHIDGAQMIPPSASPGVPPFMSSAQDLLRGRPINSAEISDLRKQVSDAKTTAAQWNAANRHAQELTASLKSAQKRVDPTDDNRSTLKDIQNRLVAVWQHLFEAATAADVLAITQVGGDLDQAQVELAQITAAPQQPGRLGVLSLTSSLLAAPEGIDSGVFQASEDLTHPEATDAKRVEMLDRGIRIGDWASIVFAFVVALVTGLSSNYLGKPFGTVQDYFNLFVWGAGTKVGLDIVASVLDKLVTSAPATKAA